MNLIKVVTFDATNTILRFKVPPWQYYSVVARDYGYQVSEDILKDKMKDSFKLLNTKHPNFGRNNLNWEKWWRELVQLTFKGQLPNNANIDKIATKLINEFRTPRCWSIADGSCQLLQVLRKNGVTIGVISNFDPRLTDILKNFNLLDCFDFILTSYDVGFSKPDQRIFSSAIKASGKVVEPSQCLHIGDDLDKDYKGAKAAGWHALLIRPSQTGNEVSPAKEHVFSSVEELNIAVQQNKMFPVAWRVAHNVVNMWFQLLFSQKNLSNFQLQLLPLKTETKTFIYKLLFSFTCPGVCHQILQIKFEPLPDFIIGLSWYVIYCDIIYLLVSRKVCFQFIL